ncbi:MAG TPA: hypothetical protein VFV79_05210 [Saprospiraceae bacterium]|nr:hypothetical protein [Saprospiraceae bacterium]
MKRISILFVLTIFLFSYASSQSVPQGMKYQAVARDAKGNILANQFIELKISLISNADRQTIVYSETHAVTTNEVGLFTLTVGEGANVKGYFEKVPWSTDDIWMAVSIKEKDATDFSLISNSRLLAVPYAFHAGTASELIGESSGSRSGNPPGVPANVWSLQGNNGTTESDHLGTSDCADLIMITNNIERLRITCAGDIDIAKSLSVGEDLDVGHDLHVGNDAVIDQDVTLNEDGGNTTVRGDLTVSDMSPTQLTGTLTVDKATDLNMTLNVDGTTTLNDDLTVTGMNPTLLTGTLTVDKATNLNSTLDVNNMAATHLTGTLTVDKATNLNSTLDVNNMAATHLTGNLTVDKLSTLNGMVSITDATQSTSTGTGALKVTGGAGIAKNAHIGGTLNVTGVSTLNNTLNVNASSSYIANFVNSTNANGISIKVAASTPDNTNNFLTFKDSGDGTVGRIEGQNASDLHNSFEYIWYNSMEAVNTVLRTAMVVVDLVGVDDFDAAVVEGAEWVTAIAEWVKVDVELELNLGVAFESGSGDYAEWLLKATPEEAFSYGDIVGIKGGKISKAMEDADQYMVISLSPIILGNMPPAEHKEFYEKVAFMGQVPVKVVGVVHIGDYILSSPMEDGFGIAVAPEDMTLDQYKRIVGTAWSASDGKKSYAMINTAVGINTNDTVEKLKKQQEELDELKMAMNSIVEYMQTKDPSFNGELFAVAPVQDNNDEQDSYNLGMAIKNSDNKMLAMADFLEHNPEILSNAMSEAKELLVAKGIDFNRFEQTSRLLNDEKYLIHFLVESSKN